MRGAAAVAPTESASSTTVRCVRRSYGGPTGFPRGTSTNTAYHTSIATDSAGFAHIAYAHDFAENDMEYATNGPELGESALVRSVQHMHVKYTPEA